VGPDAAGPTRVPHRLRRARMTVHSHRRAEADDSVSGLMGGMNWGSVSVAENLGSHRQ
jgi:hypothetical protein